MLYHMGDSQYTQTIQNKQTNKHWKSLHHLGYINHFDDWFPPKLNSIRWLSHLWLFATPWTAACQVSLSFTISWSLLRFMSIELMMPSNHLILCPPLLLPSVFPSFRVFSSELALHIRWPKYWSFSFSISPSIKYSGLSVWLLCHYRRYDYIKGILFKIL